MPKQDYLFKRPDRSRFYQLRLVTPAIGDQPRKTTFVTTGCEDFEDALEWATPRILSHLKMIASRKARHKHPWPKGLWSEDGQSIDQNLRRQNWADRCITPIREREMKADSSRQTPDGGRLECSEDGETIAMYSAAGKFLGARPNAEHLVGFDYSGDDRTHREIRQREAELKAKLAKDNPELGLDLDERMIAAWTEHRNVSDAIRKDMRRAYKTMKQVAPNRNFATIRPEDVARMVAIWRYDNKNSTGAMVKKLGHLKAIVNVCLDRARRSSYPELKENVFEGDYIPDDIDGERAPTHPFDSGDFKIIMADLPSWPRDWQLLFLLGRVYGLRASECWTIRKEEMREGIRCLLVEGTKNDFGIRAEPIPAQLEPYLPAKIDGCLFEHSESHVNGKMMERIRALLEAAGIDHYGKTHQSLRHACETDLGSKLKIHPKIVDAIMGHAPDDLKGNLGDNSKIRRDKSVTYRYFHGNAAAHVLEALDQFAGLIWGQATPTLDSAP